MVEDEDPLPTVRLLCSVNGGTVQIVPMEDDGNHYDSGPGDGIYGAVLQPFQLNETLSWQVQTTDQFDQATLLPCTPALISFLPSSDPLLFINELMADNDATFADEFGEYDDWAEIYNGDDQPVWLGDKYLTDNLSNPNKWQLPDYTMEPGTFLIIWCDDQPEQGPFHATFKLSNDGEELGIFDNETTGYFLIDSVTFGLQTVEISYGRQNDGVTPWIFFTAPTPGASNQSSGMDTIVSPGHLLKVYPNPAMSGTIRFADPFTGWITDMTGQVVWTGTEAMSADISGLSKGIYIICGMEGGRLKLIRQ